MPPTPQRKQPYRHDEPDPDQLKCSVCGLRWFQKDDCTTPSDCSFTIQDNEKRE